MESLIFGSTRSSLSCIITLDLEVAGKVEAGISRKVAKSIKRKT